MIENVSKSSFCHLCGNGLFFDPILELKGMPKAAQFYPEQSEFDGDVGIDLLIYQCSGCGLVQHKRTPVEYFREVITAASLSPKSKAFRLVQMKEFKERFGLSGKKVLDIGAGKGEMVDVLKEVGLQAVGIEASLYSVGVSRAAGRNMVCGYIGDSSIEGAPYDAFIMLNYLEHLPAPGVVIRNIYQNTTDNAVGFVTVPNLEYLLSTNAFYEFVVDHISYFVTGTLRFAFEMNGFAVVDSQIINEGNDIAIQVQKKTRADLSKRYSEVEELVRSFRKILEGGKRVAVWGAGHRTLALLALSNAKEVAYVVDSAKFKQGRFTPILHTKIVPPERLKEDKVDMVVVMVPGLYPEEVLKMLKKMEIGAEVAVLRDNKIEFLKE